MNKGHLSEAVAKRLGIPVVKAQPVVDAVLEEIARAIVRRENLGITGFGLFTVAERAPRLGRNPQNGDPVDIPATVTVKFRAGVRLLEYLRGEKTVTDTEAVVGKLPRNGKKAAEDVDEDVCTHPNGFGLNGCPCGAVYEGDEDA